jgi:hypothetical protein
MGGKRTRRSLEVDAERVSPPSKMRSNSESSKSDEILAKLDSLENRFKAIEKEVGELTKTLREIEKVKSEVESLKSTCEGYQRFELENKKRSVLVRGLPFKSQDKFESRTQTRAALAEFFTKLGMTPTLVDYQRLGGVKEGEDGSKISVRLQFVDLDQKFEMYDKLKLKGRELKEVSILTDYPSFQIPEFKKLSNQAFNVRQANPGTKTRIVPKGLGLVLQQRVNGSSRWTPVSVQ